MSQRRTRRDLLRDAALAVGPFALPAAPVWAFGKPPAGADATPAYEAEAEHFFGETRWKTSVLLDRGRIVLENPSYDMPLGELRAGRLIYFADRLAEDLDKFLIWEYDPERKTARPTEWTCTARFIRLVEKEGADAIRERFALPKNFIYLRKPNSPPPLPPGVVPSGSEPSRRQFPVPAMRPPILEYGLDTEKGQEKGTEKIAGRHCTVYTRGSRSSFSYYEISVDPESNLVLRYEGKLRPETGFKGRHQGYTVRRIQYFDRQLPASRFQLPPGTTVYLPRMLENESLPSGVIRKPMTGPEAQIGIRTDERNSDIHVGG